MSGLQVVVNTLEENYQLRLPTVGTIAHPELPELQIMFP